VMTTGLEEKYGIACDPDKFVEKVKALCPCWEGHETEQMLGEWNTMHVTTGAAIEDVDKRKRYNVQVEYTKITSFEETRAEMERQQALKLLMLCTMITVQQGHELHAVALRSTAPGRKMEAVNSWGANQPLVEIDEANFCYAIRFDPLITAAAKSGGVKIACPPVRKMFSDRVQEQVDIRKKAEQEQDDKRKKAEQEQDDKRKKAEQEQDDKRKKAEQAKRERVNQTIFDQENLSPQDSQVRLKVASGEILWSLLVRLLTYFCVSYISSHFFKSATAHFVNGTVKYVMMFFRWPGQAEDTPWNFFYFVFSVLGVINLICFCLSYISELCFKSQYTIFWVTDHFVNAFKYLVMLPTMFGVAVKCHEQFFGGYPPLSTFVIFVVFVYDGWYCGLDFVIFGVFVTLYMSNVGWKYDVKTGLVTRHKN